ncbi:phenylalanine--tRNA ligase subunit beta [Blochmannia endosymbiont of Colobopsis nipponica]|uniref:phenylalanine--tRNA ligase subunit beta n=1 Tax=Blochmannia endosymbiont of Colobopsis nipponica TaxID=2681987 RepID=UPI00177C7A17|nr:phenylalanine--tRNA ligase subunit beta [Blochmannia endosymbiont of Colobopsis nipponica]QOI11089.1 phenylalanine--tRNA ligase subunit beta [Blochmannia endosymbiont of Colobopsis nipponica]
MKFSEFWLREWINLDINSNMLTEKLTMAGLKTNLITPYFNYFSKIIIGLVLKRIKHPDVADAWILTVDIGDINNLSIISNIDNCCVNSKIIVAKSDSIALGNKKEKNNNKYGLLPEWSLCSFKKLGIVYNDIDITTLPKDAPIGSNFKDYLKLDDNILDINIPINRADCFGLYGIARDLSIINKTSLKQPKTNFVIPTLNDTLLIKIEEPNACPYYLSRIIKGIDNTVRIPLWMREKLRKSGICFVNPITDISNYVILELGCPINIFNLDKIHGGICVRLAHQHETIKVPKDILININTDTLIIADAKQPLALAGILNGENSIIDSSTCNILLECAVFHPSFIIGKTKQYNLDYSFSSHYYERGIDPTLIKLAIERVTYFLIKICGGYPGPVINLINEKTITKKNFIILRRNKIKKFIGYFISDNKVHEILKRTGCIIKRFKDGWKVLTPTWRFDLKLEEDLIEEIIRIYGYNMLPSTSIYTALQTKYNINKNKLPLLRIKNLLVDRDYQEVITYSFVDPKIQNLLHPEQVALRIINPITKEMSVMRLSLWSGLVNTVIYNQNRQQQQIRLFESGMSFSPNKMAYMKVDQYLTLSGIITGVRYEEHWDCKKNNIMDFYDIKGDVEAILDMLGKLNDVEFKIQINPALHPGQSASIFFQNEYIGCIGMIHPSLEKKLNLRNHTLVFEIIWDKIAEYRTSKIKDIPRFPINRRDIAIIVSEQIAAIDIINECKKSLGKELIDIKLFDIYRGIGINKEFKSLAISLFLYNNNYTLKEIEITKMLEKCLQRLKLKFKASLKR